MANRISDTGSSRCADEKLDLFSPEIIKYSIEELPHKPPNCMNIMVYFYLAELKRHTSLLFCFGIRTAALGHIRIYKQALNF